MYSSSRNNIVDIVLVILEKPVKFTKHTQPAALPPNEDIPDRKSCRKQSGRALLCLTPSKSNKMAWALYGMQIGSNQCPHAPFLYTRIDEVLNYWITEVMHQKKTYRQSEDHIFKTAILWPPPYNTLDDIWGSKILKIGQLFKTPYYYDLKPIKKPRIVITGPKLLEKISAQ
uniref:Uncharacterized protein n=1 Tax=Romanomermis culicivorax TaxID=13658 RepID=A0A915K9Y9_ROMCU